MELKKNPKYDLEAKRGIFRNLGLTISLLAVILVFEMPPRGEEVIIDLGESNAEIVELIDIPPTTQPPPPPPVMTQVTQIVEVSNEVEIEEEIEVELDVEVTEVTIVEDITFNAAEVEEEVAEEIFLVVEDEPMFPGGIEAFYAFVGERIRYPAAARKAHVEGRVYVQFVIEKDGSLSDLQVLKGIGSGCDEEAIRVLKLVPKFHPGKQRGLPVRVKKVFPIYFKLAEI